MFANVNHVVILKGRKTDYKYPYFGKKASIRLCLFLMKVKLAKFDVGFTDGKFTKCATRLCFSTAKFFGAAGETFTQYNIEYGLLENFSFNFKFNVPVGF